MIYIYKLHIYNVLYVYCMFDTYYLFTTYRDSEVGGVPTNIYDPPEIRCGVGKWRWQVGCWGLYNQKIKGDHSSSLGISWCLFTRKWIDISDLGSRSDLWRNSDPPPFSVGFPCVLVIWYILICVVGQKMDYVSLFEEDHESITCRFIFIYPLQGSPRQKIYYIGFGPSTYDTMTQPS